MQSLYNGTRYLLPLSLIYLALIVGHFADRCAWRLVAQVLLLFDLAVIQGPSLLFECVTANITFLAHLEKALENLSAVYLPLISRRYQILRHCKWFPGFADTHDT
jgi:hypothetical protein